MTSVASYVKLFNTGLFGGPQEKQQCAPFELLPGEILLDIAEYLPTRAEKLCLAMTSKVLYPKVMSTLYASVRLEGFAQCKDALTMLRDTPELARHVLELTVYPDHVSDTQVAGYEESAECGGVAAGVDVDGTAELVSLLMLAGSSSLSDEASVSCPNLKNLGLFAFNDLESFTLYFKQTFYLAGYDLSDMENAIIYNRIWDMLIRRSPNLRSLAIEGEWDEPIFAARLLEGNWPRLQKLSLTPVWFQEHIHEGSQLLVEFLERHPAIEELSLKRVRLDLSQLSPEALPKLRVFNGRLDHLRELGIRGHPLNALGLQNPSTQLSSSPLSHTLEELILPDAMALRELTPLAISSMLVGLRSLTSLTISFSLESGYDSNGVFRTIASACPQLQNLDLSCTSRPSFALDVFSRTLRSLTKLRTLSLALVKVPGDESMQAGAVRITLSNPRLARFKIAFLQSSRALRRSLTSTAPRVLEQGRYVPIRDAHGIPVGLLASESWYRFGGFGRRMTRRTVCELRPSGHPDAARKGWRSLLFERSPAGEEARLLVFSCWLLILAVGGIFRGLAVNAVDNTSSRVAQNRGLAPVTPITN
ncbi:uncharacterized protein PHACADRAFT_185339 [Phanerochaete carnosa HHB-10118-sp]|uniref:F-box domain-containing protein n=1 Tax=Phanerochaete carnosa (strain HHB-10118-sp) TaxID=650164 RepID=K5W640_PHACS|nr:uncharacterized protein PHACADRAFT_185339 [Phanerochaete carnosa HHB-10118-sp]EKM54414.1 hypothetical protein PHACADRAFT_185339 [Phanerochaete carnosa HHB-10118-sp]